MERFGDGVENLVHLYGVFIYSALEFEEHGGIFQRFCIQAMYIRIPEGGN